MKFILNGCYGGYDFSNEFLIELDAIKVASGKRTLYKKIGTRTYLSKPKRFDVDAIKLMEQWNLEGRNYNTKYSNMYIEEIDDDVCGYFHEYDGREEFVECNCKTLKELKEKEEKEEGEE